jgi:hypothetical protein
MDNTRNKVVPTYCPSLLRILQVTGRSAVRNVAIHRYIQKVVGAYNDEIEN